MNKKTLIILLFVGAAVLLGIFFIEPREANAGLDSFAQCLAGKEITMYGAAWCSHCQNEKKAFGDSFKFVPYVECPENTKECLAKGINSYPTWIFPDGRKFVGEQGLNKLAEESSCILPQENQ